MKFICKQEEVTLGLTESGNQHSRSLSLDVTGSDPLEERSCCPRGGGNCCLWMPVIVAASSEGLLWVEGVSSNRLASIRETEVVNFPCYGANKGIPREWFRV